MARPASILLDRIAQSGQGKRRSVLRREPREDRLPVAIMHEPRHGEWKVDDLATLVSGGDVHDPRRLLERQPAQEQIVDQAEDRRVQPDPEREGDHRQKSESRRFAQLPQSETKIGHHMNLHVGWATNDALRYSILSSRPRE